MSIIDELIYDRTQLDVDRWAALRAKGYDSMTEEERAEWDAGMRGAYNLHKDFNRVESAVRYLADRLNGFGFALAVETKTDWTREDIPTPADLERYLDNVRTIRSSLAVLETTPQTPDDMDGLWWYEANDIERILSDIEMLIDSMRAILLRTAQPLLHPGFSIYMPEQKVALYARKGSSLFSSDGFALYTSDGEPVGAQGAVPIHSSEGMLMTCSGGTPVYVNGIPIHTGGNE